MTTTIGQTERATQDRVITLFREALGYRYQGDWTDRPQNSNIETGLLSTFLSRNYTPRQISRALDKLRIEADNPNRSLYENNKGVYAMHYLGDLSMPLHNIEYNAFNKANHVKNDGVVDGEPRLVSEIRSRMGKYAVKIDPLKFQESLADQVAQEHRPWVSASGKQYGVDEQGYLLRAAGPERRPAAGHPSRAGSAGSAMIADGYHRMCAVYSFDEDEVVSCKTVSGVV
jgi:hypothetical protein